MADSAERYIDERVGLLCQLVSTEGDQVTILTEVSSQFGTQSHLGYSAAGDTVRWGTGSSTVEVASDRSGLTASYDLFTVGPEPDFELGEFVGTAVLNVEFTPDGDPITSSFRDTASNSQLVVSSVLQPQRVTTGFVVLPADAGTYNLAECDATTSTVTVFETNPDTYVNVSEFMMLRCTWEVADGFVYLDAAGDRREQSTSLVVDVSTGSYFAFPGANLSRSGFEASYALESFGSGVGSATVSASVSALGDHEEETIRDGDFKQTTLTQALKLDGTLSITTPDSSYQLSLNTESCTASHQRTIFQASSPSDP